MSTVALTNNQIQILKHTIGINRKPIPYRNHFVASEGHSDMPNIKILVELGFMAEATPEFLDSKSQCFYATDEGRRVALACLKQGIPMSLNKSKPNPHARQPKLKDGDKDWATPCQNCDQLPTVSPTDLCGPCCWGEADTAGGNW